MVSVDILAPSINGIRIIALFLGDESYNIIL